MLDVRYSASSWISSMALGLVSCVTSSLAIAGDLASCASAEPGVERVCTPRLVESIFSRTHWRRALAGPTGISRSRGRRIRSTLAMTRSSMHLPHFMPRAAATSAIPSRMVLPLLTSQKTIDRQGTMVLRRMAVGSMRAMILPMLPSSARHASLYAVRLRRSVMRGPPRAFSSVVSSLPAVTMVNRLGHLESNIPAATSAASCAPSHSASSSSLARNLPMVAVATTKCESPPRKAASMYGPV